MQQLSEHEASFLDADTVHANSNVTFVQIYDQSTVPGGQLRFKTILAHIEQRLHRNPIFRRKLQRVPLELEEPYWVDDEFFDLEYHVRHIALPKPGDWRQFCIQASRIHSRALDLDRPLWEIYVLEGLDHVTDLPVGSFALLTKIHHAAIDVETRNDFVEVLHDTLPRPPRPDPPPPWFPRRRPRQLKLLTRAWTHLLFSPSKMLRPLTRLAPAASTFVRDLTQPALPLTGTRFDAVVSAHRVFDTRRFLREEFERIRDLVPGATINDAVIAVCAGGLRRYLEGHGELPELDLQAIVSLDIGADRSPEAANRAVRIGTELADPLQRLRAVQARLRRDPTGDDSGDDKGGHKDRGPAVPQPSCAITHVPGPAAPVYLQGARMTYFSALMPIADGLGLVFAVSGYDGRIVVSPTSCRELMPDPEVFTQCVRDSFQEYLALADRPPAARKRARSTVRTKTARPASPRKPAAAKPSPPAHQG